MERQGREQEETLPEKYILKKRKTMNPLYNFAISAYRTAVRIASVRNDKAKRMLQGHAETFGILKNNIGEKDDCIWIHASSLGEFEQGRPIIESIKSRNPGQKILLTFFSPSGYDVRKDYPLADTVCYLPFDLPRNVEKFLDMAHPRMAIFIKYEFWGNYLNALNNRGIPAYIISAIFRPTQLFFKPYGKMFRRMLGFYKHLFVQDETSRELLAGIGVTNVSVTGDTRFDRVIKICDEAAEIPFAEAFSAGHRTLIAGSSWPHDEEIFIEYFNSHPGMKLIIAPHEINDGHLEYITSLLKRPWVRYSEREGKNPADYDCLIIDCFGLLSSIYRYGQTAYIGGGFGAGIHNVPEAAVYGIPVIFGPNYKKFKEAHDLLENKGAYTISDASGFNAVMQLLDNEEKRKASGEAAGKYIRRNAGATERIIEMLPIIK